MTLEPANPEPTSVDEPMRRHTKLFSGAMLALALAGGGTGLGPAIAKELVETRGTLSVESELGRGSVFTVALPE